MCGLVRVEGLAPLQISYLAVEFKAPNGGILAMFKKNVNVSEYWAGHVGK